MGHDPRSPTAGHVVAGVEAVVSHEHDGARWVKAVDMAALLTDDTIEAMGQGNEHVLALLRNVRADLERYLGRVG